MSERPQLPFAAQAASACLAAAVALPCCSHDVVLPAAEAPAVCGDGAVQAGEDCDTADAGCTDCQLVPGYTCTAFGCSVVCGDGVIGDDASCTNARKSEACDMNGYWVARQTDFRRDRVLGAIQTTSSWFLYRLSQAGAAFQVDESLYCGSHTSGTATVDLTPASLRALLTRNDESATGAHGPRKGTFLPAGGGCSLTLDRFYTIRGGTADLLPVDFAAHPDLATLPKLPRENDPLHPTGATLTFAEDTDGDGIPGFGVGVTGIVAGVREMAQREYKEYATLIAAPAPANAITLTVPGAFDAEESVLGVRDCGDTCGLITTVADPARNVTPRLTLRFVGKTLGSARVAPVVRAHPRDSVDSDLETCARVRLVLPHDPAQQ